MAKTQVQASVMHLIRNSLDFVNWKDRKLAAAKLKTVSRATAVTALESFAAGLSGG